MTVEADDRKDVFEQFEEVVNMTNSELEKWLETEESKGVGQKSSPDAESVGHASGRHIIDIRSKKKSDLTDADYEHMKKVHSYVARHMAQKPDSDIEDSPWRFSLMNWGHDPLKK